MTRLRVTCLLLAAILCRGQPLRAEAIAIPVPAASVDSTELSSSEAAFGGAIGVRAMFYMQRLGNQIEFMDWFREAYPVSLARLDLRQNFSTLTSLELGLRSPSDSDLGIHLGLRSLPYFSTDHHFTDSMFFNLPLFFPNQRQHFWGDLTLRKFPDVPTRLTYDVNAMKGIGPDRDRSYLDEVFSITSHGRLPWVDLDVEIPFQDFTDRHDPVNDTRTRGFSVSATRTVMDGMTDLQATYRQTVAYLDNIARTAQTDVYELRAMLYEIFGVDGFKLDMRGSYRETPIDLGLTARTDDFLNAKAVLSLTQASGYSVQVGTEHRKIRRERLLRAGFDRLGVVATATRADLAPFRVTEEPRFDDLFGRIFFRFRPWASATYFHRESAMEDEPATDLVRNNSPALLFDHIQDKRADLQLQPLDNVGVNFRLAQQQNKNFNRGYRETVRNQQTDFYWLLVNGRLNIGGTFAYLDILPSPGDVFGSREDSHTRGASISYQLSPELSFFSDYTIVNSLGLRESNERIANIGVEAGTGTRHRITWRAAYTIDEMITKADARDDFDMRGLNISGEAQF